MNDERVAEAARAAMDAVRALNESLAQANQGPRIDAAAAPTVVSALVALVERGLCTLNAFELLLKLSPAAAIDVLLRRYLGEHVDPDTRAGGYEADLSVMLSDMVEILGAPAVEALIDGEQIAPAKLRDRRVLAALADALDVEEDDLRRRRGPLA
jgi:hypothetical protein